MYCYYFAVCTGSNAVVRLTVRAGGGPYGKVRWEKAKYMTSRRPQTASMTMLYLTRTGGSQGRLRIHYR